MLVDFERSALLPPPPLHAPATTTSTTAKSAIGARDHDTTAALQGLDDLGHEVAGLGRVEADLDARVASASILAAAVPLPPETIAPAWPIFLPGGAVTPAM